MTTPFRYRKLGYLALNVTDIERTSAFAYDIVGLEPAGTGPGGERFFRCGTDRHSIVLSQAVTPGFKRAGWDLESAAEVDKAYAYFEALGYQPQWLDQDTRSALNLTLTQAFRVRDPYSGACFEFYSGMDQTIVPFPGRLAKIQRLGHFALNVPDVQVGTRHFLQTYGFASSDVVGNYVSFMRAFPNPLHHSFGVGRSATGGFGFNHVNFMVTDIDDIGRLQYRLKKNNVKIVFGMGRHPTSDSIFLYFLDPDGMTWEYSFGMELFPEVGAREARSMSARPEDFDFWGAMPEPEFTKGGNIDTSATS